MFNQQTTKLIGTTLKSLATFTSTSNVKIIPDSVTLRYRKPSGELLVGQVEVSGFEHSSQIYLDAVGEWFFRWECSGSYASADEFSISVQDTKVK